MPKVLPIEHFLQKAREGIPLLDVRSPAEFESGHIPKALSLPLFDNEERAVIGTLYKQTGKQPALKKGLEIAGPKMVSIIGSAEQLSPTGEALLYCWRGGMRSGSMAWLLELYGFQVNLLKGGYKSFRRWALNEFNKTRDLTVLGGKTGSGKTHVLHALASLGEQIIDLEALAHHKGSAFGAIGEAPPPSQEQFENKLAAALSETDPSRPLWVEDESRMIGRKIIPQAFWEQMRESSVVYLDIPLEERISTLVNSYGNFSKKELESSILKISKRLGGLATKEALNALATGDLTTTARILLAYYDKTYLHGLSKRDPASVKTLSFHESNPESIARAIMNVK